MAARESNFSFVTIDEARAFLDLGADDTDRDGLLFSLITAAVATMEGYTNRRLFERAYSNVILDGYGTDQLCLPEYPLNTGATLTVLEAVDRNFSIVTALEALDATGTNYSTAGFVSNADEGILTRLNAVWPTGRSTVMVTYTAGYQLSNERFAEQLKTAQRRIIADLWASVGRDPTLSSRSIGGLSETFLSGTGPDSGKYAALKPEVRMVLDQFRREAWQSP